MVGRRKGRADGHRREKLRELGAGVDSLDPGHRCRGAGVDRPDACVCEVAAFERQMLHANERDVVDVGASTLDETRIFATLDALADEFWQDRSGRHGHLPCPAAR